MKKFLALMLTLVMVVSMASCAGKGAGKGASSTGTDSKDGTTTTATEISVSLASEPGTMDPALNTTVDGGTMCAHLFSGLVKWNQTKDGKLELVADAAKELVDPTENSDGTVTYTYTLRDGLKWSDGKDVTAKDFVFAWNRAAGTELAADYSYMFQVIQGYDKMWETRDTGKKDDKGEAILEYVNPDAKLAVEAPDDKTIKVTLTNNVAYWNELLAFPAYYPVREDVVSNENWATDPKTYVSNGAYTLTGWDHNSLITLTKNPDYYDAANITMDTIKFCLSDDANNMLSNFKKGDWQMIDDVPTNEIETLKKDYPDEFKIAGQLGTYYVCWNINEEILPSDSTLTGEDAEKAKEEIRNAVNQLFDRNYIAEKIGQAGQQPASSFVAMGLTEPDGSEFYENAGHNKDFTGYYNVSKDAFESTYSAAVETLKKYYKFDDATQKFTNFPTLTYLYNTGEGHKAIAEYLQSALAGVGITMNLENQEWATFVATRKAGDYSIARNGWLGDYNDPISFLDMWVSNSGNNDVQYGKGNNASLKLYDLDLTPYGYDVNVKNGTWADTYDVLISTIKTCNDNEKRYKMMHLAEDMLMETGCICPLYYYTDIYMISKNVKGFYSSPLGYKFFMNCTIEK